MMINVNIMEEESNLSNIEHMNLKVTLVIVKKTEFLIIDAFIHCLNVVT
jgi:hypothetical protein